MDPETTPATDPAKDLETTPAPADTPETTPQETPAEPQQKEATPPTETPAETPDKPDELDTDILDLAKTPEETDAAKAEQDKAAEAEYLKAAGFGEEGIKELSLGKAPDGSERTLPADDVGALLSAMRHVGVPADKAQAMLATVGALDVIRAERQEAQDKATLRSIREETRKEFGDGLREAARDMQSAGLRVFGADLWADICTIPALTNDKRFVRAMAAIGRGYRNDTGGPAPTPASGSTSGALKFDLQSWMKGTQG